MKYLLAIHNAGENYSAHFPDVLGFVTVGDTVEEIVRNAADGLELHLEGEPAPPARSLMEIAADPEEDLSDAILAWVEYHEQALAPA